MKRIISFSGGIDSTTALLHFLEQGDQIRCVGFDYGQRHRVELEYAHCILETLRGYGHTIDFRVLAVAEIFHGIKSALLFSSDVPVGEYSKEVLKSTIVPNRNAVFASILYAMAVSSGYDSVVFGVHAGDSITYPDCRKEFWSALQVALQSGNESLIQLVTPFIEMSKAEIVASAMKTCRSLSLDFDEVYCNCWSSYDPNHVGQTSTDIERAKAFEANEIPDPFMKASR